MVLGMARVKASLDEEVRRARRPCEGTFCGSARAARPRYIDCTSGTTGVPIHATAYRGVGLKKYTLTLVDCIGELTDSIVMKLVLFHYQGTEL